ncbi:MAG TPA: hypothetical protein P5556_07805 [Candidatus Gastranaerophilales bacterium]|nr:hypothetical protein [Candidatus Gastranaerophilales bacterium]
MDEDNKDNEKLSKKNSIRDISQESGIIKARLKSKYLLYKLQRDFFKRKFY